MTLLSETDGYGWWHLGDAVPARATHAPHRANLRCLGLSVGIAIALAGCSRRGEMLIGEAAPVDYQMADLLAPSNTPSGAVARRGLADGYLSASEASAMWEAYRAERDARAAADKAAIISRWKHPAIAPEAHRAETPKSGSVHEGAGPKDIAQDIGGPSQ